MGVEKVALKEQSPYHRAQNASLQTQNNDARWKAFGQKPCSFQWLLMLRDSMR
jgi:hypothetical protein